jgi:hypothetical protein
MFPSRIAEGGLRDRGHGLSPASQNWEVWTISGGKGFSLLWPPVLVFVLGGFSFLCLQLPVP